MTAGELFRTTRQQRNLSVEEVSQRTKIRPRIIEAMEQDDFATLPPAYMGSFVKTYSRFLNIGDLPAINGLETQLAPTLSREQLAHAQHTAKTNGVHNGTAFASIHAHSSNGESSSNEPPLSHFTTSRRPSLLKYVAYAGVFMLLGVAGYVFWQQTFVPPPETTEREIVSQAESIPGSKPLQITAEAAAENGVVLGRVADNATQQAIPDSDSLILEARATESAWINIVMDKKRSEQLTLEAGKSYRWSAERLITLQLGNAGGVQFRRNGVALEPFGKSGAVVRNIVITREVLNSSSSPALAQKLAAAESVPVGTTAAGSTSSGTTSSGTTPPTNSNSPSNDGTATTAANTEVKRDSTMRTKRFITPKRQQPKMIETVSPPLAPPDVKQQIEKPRISQQTVSPVDKRN